MYKIYSGLDWRFSGWREDVWRWLLAGWRSFVQGVFDMGFWDWEGHLGRFPLLFTFTPQVSGGSLRIFSVENRQEVWSFQLNAGESVQVFWKDGDDLASSCIVGPSSLWLAVKFSLISHQFASGSWGRTWVGPISLCALKRLLHDFFTTTSRLPSTTTPTHVPQFTVDYPYLLPGHISIDLFFRIEPPLHTTLTSTAARQSQLWLLCPTRIVHM